jgi:glycosyltransferase involved in cell wall biosynthesis
VPAPIIQSPPRIVYAGRLVEKKGIDKVVEAFAIVRKVMPEAELHVAGDGPLRPLVERAAREIGAITVHGAMPNTKLLDLMASARVFTMPSREAADGDSEGFGLVLIEAQSMGVPVVTSNQTGAAEALADGKTGFTTDPTDADALATAYLRFLSNAELAAKMGREAFAYVRENFDIKRQSARLEAIYDDVLEATRSKR